MRKGRSGGSRTVNKKKNRFQRLDKWLDAVFMLPGMVLVTYGVFQLSRPAGFIVAGVCCIALAFFTAAKQAGDKG